MDTIGDFLARIKNGYLARKKEVITPWSKMLESLAAILKKHGYIGSFQIEKLDEKGIKKQIRIRLRYLTENQPALSGCRRVSKPGRRLYARADKIPYASGGAGITIVSTPKGIMTDREARKAKLGGEILCQVW